MSSNVETIASGSEYNFNNIKYANPRIVPQGGKNIKVIDKSTGEWLQIATPLMLTFGISEYMDEKTGLGKGVFELSQLFPNPDYQTPETLAFLENMIKFEAKIKADALTNSKEWFGKLHKSSEVVDALWSPMLKYKKDKTTGEYDLTSPPSIRVKVKIYNHEWKCEMFDEDGEILYPNPNSSDVSPLTILPAGKKANVATVLTCGGIWFTNGKFTVTWELGQAVTQKPRERLLGKGVCRINLNQSDKDKMKRDAEAEAIKSLNQSNGDNEDEDQQDGNNSDGEAEQEVEQETNIVMSVEASSPVVAEEVQIPKKKVTKKKV